MNYFDQIAEHISKNQTSFRFGDVEVEITKAHTIARHPNGSKCYFFNIPADPSMQCWINVEVVTSTGERDTSMIEPTIEAAKRLADQLFHDDHDPLWQVIQLLTKRMREKYGVLRFGYEQIDKVVYSVYAASPSEVDRVHTLVFMEDQQFEPYYYSAYTGAMAHLNDAENGDPAVMKRIKTEARKIQEQLQRSVSFKGKNTIRLLPAESGRAEVRLASRIARIKTTPNDDGTFTFFPSTRDGKAVNCQPTEASCERVCQAVGLPTRDYPKLLVELLQHVQQNAK